MRKKLIPLIAIAFVVAVLSTAVFYSLFAGRLNGAPAETAVPRTKIVVAARDIAAGTVLTERDLSAAAWMDGAVPKGAYQSVGGATGKTTLSAMVAGEPVLESHVASRDGTGSGIPEGMRAISVHVSDSSGVVGMIKPGFKVDVQEFASRSAKGPKDEVRTLLRGVTVIAVNAQPEQSSQGYFAAPVVTLLASAGDAEELAQADSYARLRLTLRNPLEQVSAPAVASSSSANTPSSSQTMRFRIRTVALTDEGLAVLARQVDQRIALETMNISVGGEGVEAAIADALRAGGLSQGESVMAAPSRRWSACELSKAGGPGGATVRLLLAPPEGAGHLRIRPEVTGVWNGRVETRSVETEADPGRVIVISGLHRGDSTAPVGKARHVVFIVAPDTRSGRSAG